ncbi:MAG: hypothetical protein GY820_04745 [Gammaproteobacteria bacterium]|nr:hypothetical protein [Gammaproteobacteria bacterium]
MSTQLARQNMVHPLLEKKVVDEEVAVLRRKLDTSVSHNKKENDEGSTMRGLKLEEPLAVCRRRKG